MRRSAYAAFMWVLGGCAAPAPDEAATASDALAPLQASRFQVTPGAFSIGTACANPVPSCNFNNPTTPYGVVLLPPSPFLGGTDGGLAGSWQLNPGEAVVFLGMTPPPAAYFGFTPYVMSVPGATGPQTLFASLTDTLNERLIMTAGGSGDALPGGDGGVFGQLTLVVFSADEATASAIVASFVDAGLPPTAANVLPLGVDAGVPLGLGDGGSTFSLLLRIGLPTDPVAEAAYEDAGAYATVYRVSPQSRLQYLVDPMFGVPAPRAPQAPQDETSLASALGTIEGNVAALGTVLESVALSPNARYGPDCIAQGVDCLGDNRDAIYSNSLQRPMIFRETGDYFVVAGVDHWKTGSTRYTNVDINDDQHLVGVAAFANEALLGSAAQFLPADAGVDPDQFYVRAFARDCSTVPGELGARYCYAVPYPPQWPSVAIGRTVSFIERAYLDPTLSPVRPDPSSLLMPQVVHVMP